MQDNEKQHQITPSGTSPNEAPSSFRTFGLEPRLIKALDALKLNEPTPVQQESIPAAMEGLDLAVSAETGTGKTAAFLLPTLHKLLQKDAPKSGTRALILTPTRELCRQSVKQCKQLSTFTHLEVNAITGGHDFKYQRAIFRKNPEVLIATPGRLKEHIERGSPDFKDLEVLILDEADRMLDMGFMDDVLEIIAACNPDRQTLLFSATLNNTQLENNILFKDLLKNPTTITLATPAQASAQITQEIVLCDDEKHKNKVLLKLLQTVEHHKAIVFTNTKTQASKLAGWLRYMDVSLGVLHGDMPQEARNEEMNRLRRGRINLLIATDVAARGLDVSGVELVVNYDLARNSEDFIHRTGRTGRAGEQGLAISLITHRDWNLMVRFERELSIKFEKRQVSGLEAKFKGPTKLKSSGKKAGTKKRTSDKDDKKTTEKIKRRHRDTKNIGKRRKPTTTTEEKSAAAKWGDGFAPAPLKKKPSTPE